VLPRRRDIWAAGHRRPTFNSLTFMFDPTKPQANTPLDAVEIRDQLNALKDLIDLQSAQVTAQGATIAAQGGRLDEMQSLIVVTDHYTMQPGDHTVICNANHDITVTLMQSGLDGVKRTVVIKNMSVHHVSVRGDIFEVPLIDADEFFINTVQYQSDWLQCDGNGAWYRIAQFKP